MEFNAQEYFEKQNKAYQNNAIKGGGPQVIGESKNSGSVDCKKTPEDEMCKK